MFPDLLFFAFLLTTTNAATAITVTITNSAMTVIKAATSPVLKGFSLNTTVATLT